MQMVFDMATQAQQAPLVKPNPYLRPKVAAGDAIGKRQNYNFLKDS